MLIAFFFGYMRREKRWYYLAFALAGEIGRAHV